MSRTGRDLPPRAAVVVVGGGVTGLSTAYHLAAAGVRDVVLVERAAFGSGSTCKAAGGVRAQFSDRVNIELGTRSLRAFERFREQLHQEIDLHQVGYLFLLDSPEHVRAFEQNVALQNELGVPSRMLSVAEANRMSPLIATDGLLAAAYSPTDGHCTPESVVLGYASAARRHGARLLAGCAAQGIDTEDGRIVAVDTAGGRIETDTVVCATGAWSREIGAVGRRRPPGDPAAPPDRGHRPGPGARPGDPVHDRLRHQLLLPREGNGLLLGMSDPHETPGFRMGRSDDWLPGLGEVMERRTPGLAEIGIAGGWAGLYEMTPDHNALVGEAGSVSRFLYATGFSGHGFLMGPAVGEVMRDLYLGRRPVVDVSGLDARRFSDAGMRPELNIV